MKYVGTGKQPMHEITGKEALKSALADMDWEFSKDELSNIIENEFFNDENELDTALVDLAIARTLLLDGVSLDEATLQQERERMIYGVLKRILRPEQ